MSEANGDWTLSAPGIHGESMPMRDLSREEVDFCIVGAGAGGGVVGAKLAEAGFSVVIVDVGPHWNPVKDFVSDEMASRKLFWMDERITGGDDPIELGSNHAGQGVGGSTVHYSMVAMRAHPEDFKRRTLEGEVAGASVCDWPLTYEELEPYYEEVEETLQIAGPTFYPWGKRRKRYPQREHELNASAQVLVRQRARNVIVAGYAIETPRLLLNSASSLFPDGLANSSGLVGKCFMVHTGEQVFAKFPERINQYKAPPPGGAITEHFNRTMPDADFVCGYTIEVVGPHPVDFAARLSTARGMWGATLRHTMMDYNYYSGLGIVGEVLPQQANTVKLHETERDQYGLAVAHVTFSHHENDKRIVTHAKGTMKEILEAAGGEDVWSADRTAHLLGTCRMGSEPSESVVNADCRAHDVPNLFICDGSVFPTSTAVNPSLTIEAIAARTADRICEIKRRE